MKDVPIINRAILQTQSPQPHFQPHLEKKQHNSAGTSSVMLQTFENYTGFFHLLPCSSASVTWTRNILFH